MAHSFEQAGGVVADVREAGDDVVQVEVTECGVVFTLPPHLKSEIDHVLTLPEHRQLFNEENQHVSNMCLQD